MSDDDIHVVNQISQARDERCERSISSNQRDIATRLRGEIHKAIQAKVRDDILAKVKIIPNEEHGDDNSFVFTVDKSGQRYIISVTAENADGIILYGEPS